MTDIFDEMLGGPSAPKPAPKPEPKLSSVARALQDNVNFKAAASGRALEDVGGVQALRRPVTISTLATVFAMDVQTITKRLIDCPHIVQGNRKLFDFKLAVSYIIKPRMTPAQFVKTLNKADLPPEINLAFWAAQRAKLKFKLEAQEAWDTHDVLAVFGDVFMTIKDVLTTAVEEIRESARLTDEQSKLFEQAIDELRETMREKLVAMPLSKRTPSILERPLFGTSKDIDPGNTDDWEDDE